MKEKEFREAGKDSGKISLIPIGGYYQTVVPVAELKTGIFSATPAQGKLNGNSR